MPNDTQQKTTIICRNKIFFWKKTHDWYIFTCLSVFAAQHTKRQSRAKVWVGFFSSPGSEVFLTVGKRSLFSLKASIKIDLHHKDNFFTLLFQLKYYLVSAEGLMFELSLFFPSELQGSYMIPNNCGRGQKKAVQINRKRVESLKM